MILKLLTDVTFAWLFWYGTLEAEHGGTGRLIVGARRLANTADPLRLKMGVADDVVVIDCERHDRVKRSAQIHHLPGSSGGTRNKYAKRYFSFVVDSYFREFPAKLSKG